MSQQDFPPCCRLCNVAQLALYRNTLRIHIRIGRPPPATIDALGCSHKFGEPRSQDMGAGPR